MAAAGGLTYATGHAHLSKKRPAETTLEAERKRLELLNLVDNNGAATRLYLPVTSSQDAGARPSPPPQPRPIASIPEKKKRERKARPPLPDDCMLVEDTPHRVYIHDLSSELSDIESDEENPIFLADIEKHLAKIPKHVLAGPELKPTKDNQLVLYSVPSSLTLPEEQDRVRKAIVEARARLRERQASPVKEIEAKPSVNGTTSVPQDEEMAIDEDPDAMDIDG